MSRRILYAPAEVADHPGGGYCYSVGPGNELYYPHVDSCFALALVLEGGWVTGGHVPEEWNGVWDAAANFTKMANLMIATASGALNKRVIGVIGAGPSGWDVPWASFYSKYDPGYTLDFPGLRITTRAPHGVDVTVVSAAAGAISLTLNKCGEVASKSWDMPRDQKDYGFPG